MLLYHGTIGQGLPSFRILSYQVKVRGFPTAMVTRRCVRYLTLLFQVFGRIRASSTGRALNPRPMATYRFKVLGCRFIICARNGTGAIISYRRVSTTTHKAKVRVSRPILVARIRKGCMQVSFRIDSACGTGIATKSGFFCLLFIFGSCYLRGCVLLVRLRE